MKDICFPTAKMNYYSEDRYNSLRNPSGDDKGYFKNCMYYSDMNDFAGAMGIDISAAGITSGMEPFRFDTYSVGGHFCIPKIDQILQPSTIQALKDAFSKYVYGDGVAEIVNDIIVAWPVILASIGIAFVAGYIFLFFLRCFGGCLIWIAFLASVLLAAGGGWYAHKLSSTEEYVGTDTADYLVYSAYTLWGVAILFVLILMCCYSRL